ncbi:MAG: transcription elongation factor GreA [Lachnospiraceae bacterium]|nr:transcription elongation factor GreA [Lachnospiraceae bacterium]
MYDKRPQLTKADVEKIEAEIEERKLVIRPQLIGEVQEARAQGDLSENFEYYAAKKAKNENEGRIRYLEQMLKKAVIISDASGSDEVGLNNIVTLYFEEDREEMDYKIVTSIRGNSLENRVSNESPIGKAIMGHKVGDRVEVKVSPDYSYYVEIRAIDKTAGEDDEIKRF